MVEHCVQPATNLKQVLYSKNAYPFGSRPYVTDCPAQGSHHIRADCDPIAQAAMRKQAARECLNIAFNPPKTKSKFCTPHVRTNLGQDLTLRIVPPNARIIQRPLATSAVLETDGAAHGRRRAALRNVIIAFLPRLPRRSHSPWQPRRANCDKGANAERCQCTVPPCFHIASNAQKKLKHAVRTKRAYRFPSMPHVAICINLNCDPACVRNASHRRQHRQTIILICARRWRAPNLREARRALELQL